MKSLPDFVTVCQPNQSRPSSYASNPENWTKSLSRISLIRGKAAIDTLAPEPQNLPKPKSFAGGLNDFFNKIGEKITANDPIERKRHISASSPNVRESDETPFSFKMETLKKSSKDTFTPILMIFIVGGVTPSEIRYDQ